MFINDFNFNFFLRILTSNIGIIVPKPKDSQPSNRTMYRRRLEASRFTSSPTTGTPSYSSVPYGRKRICYNVSRATSHRGPRTDRFLLPPTCRRIHKTKNNYPSWAPHACNSHNPIPHQGRRFLQGLKILPRKSPLPVLLSADQATLKITNQTNGRMGETITHETVSNQTHGPEALQCSIHVIGSSAVGEWWATIQ
jgi:hypothetical protein